MKYVFIVNPVAGKKDYQKYIDNIKQYCEKNKKPYEIRLTKMVEDGTKIAREYQNTKSIIYAVGGDGTLNEVLNGIVGSKNRLGIVPTGSGNDFYKSISGIDEPEFVIDLGRVNNRYFINITSFGMDAEVNYNAQIMKEKGVSSEKIYNKSIISTFLRFKFKEIKYLINKKKASGLFTIIAVCNGRYYGSGYQIAPKADLQDGLFDIYFVKKVTKLLIPGLIKKMQKGEHESSKSVVRVKESTIIIESKQNLICNIDGEVSIDKKFELNIENEKITIDNNQEMIKAILGSDL